MSDSSRPDPDSARPEPNEAGARGESASIQSDGAVEREADSAEEFARARAARDARIEEHGRRARGRVANARLMLIFTPELCGERDPLEVLDAVLEHVDVVQVRPKSKDSPTEARAALEWSRRVLEVVAKRPALDLPVLVNDRVDVADALLEEGLAGVHLGQDDSPPELARERLGPHAVIGLSTHDASQVVEAGEAPVDYLGFGPVFATETKGYTRGRGAEGAWVASQASELPLFAIGGIDETNVVQLAPAGRIAVASAILSAPDPAVAAARIRGMLLEP